MILKIQKITEKEKIENLKKFLNEKDINFLQEIKSDHYCFFIKSKIQDLSEFEKKFPYVSFVKNKSGRRYEKKDRIIKLENGLNIGGDNFTFIAGPCSVESEEQIVLIAKFLKGLKVDILRGGAYKPRTSPYDFQGMGKEGILLLEKAKKASNLPIITEIMSPNQLEYFDNVDIIQVGARNMQNYELLKELGKIKKPILLKRGFSATYKELILSSEYILNGGNDNVILCERGIRTFENSLRNTFDITAIPYIKENTNLPIIADPSHAVGLSRYVSPISKGAVAAGANGLMVEVHNNPALALSDGEQALDFENFKRLKKEIDKIRMVIE